MSEFCLKAVGRWIRWRDLGKASRRISISALVLIATAAFSASAALATIVPLGPAFDYGILYEGTGGHKLSITNATIDGTGQNIGVGGTGVVQFSGPGAILGGLYFSAANNGQFHTNSSNVGPYPVNYSVTNVTNALSAVNSLSSSLAGLGNSLALSGTQTVNESAGTLQTIGGTTYRIFNVTSYSSGPGKMLTIVGDGSGNPVVFNFGFKSNVILGGGVTLTGLQSDQVLYNFTSSGMSISLNTNANASKYSSLSFKGIILAPNDVLTINNANLIDGRIFGGDSGDMQISNSHVTVPVPGAMFLLASGLAGLAVVRRRLKKWTV
jgi:hypothetical protein